MAVVPVRSEASVANHGFVQQPSKPVTAEEESWAGPCSALIDGSKLSGPVILIGEIRGEGGNTVCRA